MSNLNYCERHQTGYLEGEVCELCVSTISLDFPAAAAENLALHLTKDANFKLTMTTTFHYHGLKIVVTPDNDPHNIFDPRPGHD